MKYVSENLDQFLNESEKETLEDKAKQAIASLKKQLEQAKKAGSFKTTIEKKAKIKELEDKIEAWEKKLK